MLTSKKDVLIQTVGSHQFQNVSIKLNLSNIQMELFVGFIKLICVYYACEIFVYYENEMPIKHESSQY